MDEMQSDDTATFAESGAPPSWLRALAVLLVVGVPGYGWLSGGAGQAAAGAVAVSAVMLAYAGLELGQRLYGGVVVDRTHLRVGTRRCVALAALDLSTLRDEAGVETYAVFGERNLRSAPIWLRDTVAVDGRDHRGRISVIVRTNRRAELVEALVAGHRRTAAAPTPPGTGVP